MRSQHTSDEELHAFLSRHPAFGGWRDKWEGVPLEFRTCLDNELPPQGVVGSVRALVLRGDQVLLVRSTVPILSVGGRGEPGETVEQTLLREVGEETGWKVLLLGVIGFIHCRHLDGQRPAWGRPAPNFIDPLFVAGAQEFDTGLLECENPPCEFVPVADVERLGVDEINRTFLREALRKRLKT